MKSSPNEKSTHTYTCMHEILQPGKLIIYFILLQISFFLFALTEKQLSIIFLLLLAKSTLVHTSKDEMTMKNTILGNGMIIILLEVGMKKSCCQIRIKWVDWDGINPNDPTFSHSLSLFVPHFIN